MTVQNNKLEQNHRYQCCLCRYFQLEGFRWGHCQILDVEVKGNCPACSIARPFFAKTPNRSDIQKLK